MLISREISKIPRTKWNFNFQKLNSNLVNNFLLLTFDFILQTCRKALHTGWMNYQLSGFFFVPTLFTNFNLKFKISTSSGPNPLFAHIFLQANEKSIPESKDSPMFSQIKFIIWKIDHSQIKLVLHFCRKRNTLRAFSEDPSLFLSHSAGPALNYSHFCRWQRRSTERECRFSRYY